MILTHLDWKSSRNVSPNGAGSSPTYILHVGDSHTCSWRVSVIVFYCFGVKDFVWHVKSSTYIKMELIHSGEQKNQRWLTLRDPLCSVTGLLGITPEFWKTVIVSDWNLSLLQKNINIDRMKFLPVISSINGSFYSFFRLLTKLYQIWTNFFFVCLHHHWIFVFFLINLHRRTPNIFKLLSQRRENQTAGIPCKAPLASLSSNRPIYFSLFRFLLLLRAIETGRRADCRRAQWDYPAEKEHSGHVKMVPN